MTRFLRKAAYYLKVIHQYTATAKSIVDFFKLLRIRLSQSKLGPLVARRPFTVRVDTEDFGKDVWLRSHTSDISVFDEIVVSRCYEPALRCLGPDPTVLVDLGANIGLASRWFAARYPGVRIIAVEPEPSNVAILRRNLAPIGGRIVPYCVGAYPRKVRLQTHNGEFAFRIVEAVDRGTRSITSEVVTLPSIMQEYMVNHIDLLKVDIEGAEQELFKESSPWISNIDSMIVECHDPYRLSSLEADLCRNGADLAVVHREVNPAFECEVVMLQCRGGPVTAQP